MADLLPPNTAAADDNVEEELFGTNDDEAVTENNTAATGATGGMAATGAEHSDAGGGGQEIDNSLFDDVNENEYDDEGGEKIDNADMMVNRENDNINATDGDDDNNNTDGNYDMSISKLLENNPPPEPLPTGWFLKKSHSYPGKFYYFNQDTGECSWELFLGGAQESSAMGMEGLNATAAAAAAAVKSILKRSSVPSSSSATANNAAEDSSSMTESSLDHKHKHGHGHHHHHHKSSHSSSAASPPSRKKIKIASDDSNNDRSERGERGDRSERSSRDKERSRDRERGGSGSDPKEVRVLHILKKHRGSRRPASWRNPKITDSKEKAIADLREIISILQESNGDAKELRATFEELAKTESDCSSAKRGGDLGFFGRKKMQPAFEKASFGLKVGQLSDIVDTSSGVHVILRLA